VELRIRVGLTAALSIGVSLAILPAAFAQYDAAPRVDVESERRAAPSEPVTLPRGVVEAASAYEAYQRKAVAIRASFKDGEAINRAMIVGETYQPEQMEEGLVAYAAMIALDDAAFVSGVRAMARGPEGAAQEADGLLADPASVTAISGSAEAAALAGAVLREEGGQLLAAGQAVKQSAYDIQRESWSRQMAPDAAGRLARAKLLSTSAVIPAPEEVSSLLQAAAGFQGRHASGERVFTPTLERGLTLAAMAKLNLYQCLAVAGPHYEDVFCLGQHAMMDTGQCIAGFGGGTPARTEPSLSSAAEGGIAVPVADNTYRR
jgi:hypothetical protein